MSITFLFQGGFKLLGGLSCVALLAACGGGGGGGGGGGKTSVSSSVVQSSAKSIVSSSVSSSSISSLSSSVSPDVVPDAFSFAPVLGASTNSLITSATITISGIVSAAPISITGGEYAIGNGAPTGNAGTITNGQTVTVSLLTSAKASITTQAVLTVGGVNGVFPVTTSNLMGGSIQGAPLDIANVVSTLAGATNGSADGVGVEASFHEPSGITTDGTNLYVVDTSNHKIRKIIIATGLVTTLAGSGAEGSADGAGSTASFHSPFGITSDGSSLYVTDTFNNKIRKIVIATGVVSTLAGSGAEGTADGTGTEASFYYPNGITVDGTNLYIADTFNHNVRKIVIATGLVTTIAGTGSIGSSEGTGTAASFNRPYGITSDGINLYVTDEFNGKIRKIVISTGVVTTLAGNGQVGSEDGAGTTASFNGPYGITSDGTNLYVADKYNNKIRKIVIDTGLVSTLTGTGSEGSVDGDSTAASFNRPHGITSDGFALFVTSQFDNKIRKIQ